MDRMSLLVKAAQQAAAQQKPFADKVILIQFDPHLTDEDKKRFKTFLKRAHRLGVPVYMYHPTTWTKVHKSFQLTPEERVELIKGFFSYSDVPDIKEKIKAIEKIPKTRIHHASSLQAAQQKLIQQRSGSLS